MGRGARQGAGPTDCARVGAWPRASTDSRQLHQCLDPPLPSAARRLRRKGEMASNLGYRQVVYLLPLDHRSSFEKGLHGWNGGLSAEQSAQVTRAKEVIYDAFKAAIASGVTRDRAAILVDEQ